MEGKVEAEGGEQPDQRDKQHAEEHREASRDTHDAQHAQYAREAQHAHEHGLVGSPVAHEQHGRPVGDRE